jgi:hypothetical protein
MKKILGSAVLLAVVAVCLTFTACPDTVEREVNFINDTSSIVIISFENASALTIPASTKNTAPGEGPMKTAKKTGEDLILLAIVFSNPQIGAIGDGAENYVQLDGAVIAGKEVKKGLALANGTIIFSPKRGMDNNPASWPKISTIPLDE